jgi:methylmalonyl-CoA/ethylmalonyl-CoA epimerase
MKIDHIGIAVKDLEQANKIYASLLNKTPEKTENIESENVLVSFFKTDTAKIELLQATQKNTPISKFISKKGEGMHHIAFEVEDIYTEISRLEKEGFSVINSTPKKGADNKLVVFLHPKTSNGVLIELCQSINR